jgi:hypothetical protein
MDNFRIGLGSFIGCDIEWYWLIVRVSYLRVYNDEKIVHIGPRHFTTQTTKYEGDMH